MGFGLVANTARATPHRGPQPSLTRAASAAFLRASLAWTTLRFGGGHWSLNFWSARVVAIKAQNARTFLKSLDRGICCVVVYGPDVGGVSDETQRAAEALAARSNPPGEIIRIDDADLEDDPDRLLVELETVPMFGGARVIRTAIGRRVNAAMLKPVLERADPPTAALVIAAGALKPTDALRKLAEASTWAAALPCYADTERNLATLIDDSARDAGVAIQADARAALIDMLGADRALSRGEMDKLILYVHGRETITLDDVQAIIGDAAASGQDRVVLASADGDLKGALTALERVVGGGQQAQATVMAMQRHFLTLHRLRAEIDGGKRFDEAVRSLRALESGTG